jgi:branched-chain amino acid transport system ATP-binding protein
MLEAVDLCKSFGRLVVTDRVSLRLDRGERRVVLGPNGAGKTTLFNLLVGELSPTSGDIRIGGRSVTQLPVEDRARMGLSRSYQKNNLFNGLTVGENLSLAAAAAMGLSHVLSRDAHRDAGVKRIVQDVAAQVGLADMLDMPVASCAYGYRRQLEVGIALAARPKVLLMDEPTSGVGPGMIQAFHRLLKTLPREITILIIEHDIDLAFDVADRITVLNYGQIVFEGTPEETRASPLVREIYLGEWRGHA